MTLPTQMLLRALLHAAPERTWGLLLQQETGLAPGTIYPILNRLERAGLIVSAWEDPAVAAAHKRPRRRYVTLTNAVAARQMLAEQHRRRKGTRLLG